MKRTLCLILVLLTFPAALATEPPDLINYQGVLRDAADNPLNGDYDMVFRFWSAETGGDEILLDRHLTVNLQAVTVTGGLFVVKLGEGQVDDGSGAGIYITLSDVFRDFGEVWLEIQVESETLSPRARVAASAFSHNAMSLGGMSAASFLDNTGSSQSKTGSLDLGALGVSGDVSLNGNATYFNRSGPDGSVFLYFFNNSVENGEWIAWDDTDARFEVSDTLYSGVGLQSGQNIYVNADGGDQNSHLFFYDSGLSTGESLSWDDASDRFLFSDDVSLIGALDAGVLNVAEDRIVFNPNGPDTTQVIEFFEDGSPNGERLQWDDADDRFEFSDDLRVFGSLSVQLGIGTDGPNIFLNENGSDITQVIGFFDSGISNGERLQWDDADDRFEFSDDLTVGGALTAQTGFGVFGIDATGQYQAFRVGGGGRFEDTLYTGVAYVGHGNEGIYAEGSFTGGEFKDTDSGNYGRVGYSSYKVWGTGTVSFVQNHPEDEGKVIVYHAPEASEVAVYTRGSARLDGGVARVVLDETFQWTANPDLGLTAHLTPRDHVASPLVAESVSTTELVVYGPDGSDASFDYLVYGLRIGFEESSVVQPKEREAYLPSMQDHEDSLLAEPALREFTAKARFEQIETGVRGRSVAESTRAAELVARIGRFDPEIHLDEYSRNNVTAADVARVSTNGAEPDEVATAPTLAGINPDVVSAIGGDATPGLGEQPPVDGRTILEVNGTFEPGDVLALDPDRPGFLRHATEMADPTVFGIALEALPDGRAVVGTRDLVEVRVDAGYGAIRPGDLLVSSPTPGHAMSAIEVLPGTILGKALDGLETGKGTIRVLITLR